MRPRQSSSGASPAQPIATSHWPWRQARPNESVISTAGRDARAARAGRRAAARAEASGSSGQQDHGVVVGRVGGVDAGVGAHEAVVGDADQHAVLGAADLARTRRARPGRGGGPCPSSAASVARARRRRDLATGAGSGPRPWRRPCGRRTSTSSAAARAGGQRGGDQRGQVVAGADLGQPGRARSAVITAPALSCGCARAGAASRACARRRRGSARASASIAARSSGVSTSSASDGTSTVSASIPAARGVLHVAVAAAGAERRRRARPGGVSSSALVPVPWRSGTISTDGAATGRRDQLVELGGVEQRAVAGDEQHPLGAAAPARGRSRAAAASLWPAGRRPRSPRAVAAGDPLGDVVGGDDEHLVDQRRPRRSAISTSENIASTSARRGRRVELVARDAAWPRSKRLDREDGERRHRRYNARRSAGSARPSAKRSVCLGAAARRRSGVSISTSVSQHGQRRRCGSSATRPSISPA